MSASRSVHAIERDHLRKTQRQLRSSLPIEEQKLAGLALAEQVMKLPYLSSACHIGLFLSFDGEINTKPLIQRLWSKNKCVYLPRLHPFNPQQLLFLNYAPHTQCITGKYGILTPFLDVRAVIPTHLLDIMFIPLVAFDRRGYRLGMGGGFYDRTLSSYPTLPFYPVGLSYSLQESAHIPNETWDKPVSEVITEKERIVCSTHKPKKPRLY